jgi:hypothetical protein
MGPLRPRRAPAPEARVAWTPLLAPDFDRAELPSWINRGPEPALSAENGPTSASADDTARVRRTLHVLMFADCCVIALAAARLLMS